MRASARARWWIARASARAPVSDAHFAFDAHHVRASGVARARARRERDDDDAGGVADDVPRVLARARGDDDDEGVPCVVPIGKTFARVRGDARRASVRGGAGEGLAREERVDGGERRGDGDDDRARGSVDG